MTIKDLAYLDELIASRSFKDFAAYVAPYIEMTEFHATYYDILDRFASGEIKKLIVTVPPQHGKSLGSSVLLPAYILGIKPDSKVCIASYAATLADKFNKRAQRVINDDSYKHLFRSRTKDGSKDKGAGSYIQTASEVEIVGHMGSLRSVGREGALTGNQVDVMIIDDLYKDAMEANSPLIRDNAWEWYISVVKTRLHNNSQELIVFTRWHEDDLIGRIQSMEEVIELQSLNDLTKDYNGWYLLNFEAIKEGDPTEIDPRPKDEVLWSERHSYKLLTEKRALDPHKFNCMYQGHPSSAEGMLYGSFATYTELPLTNKKANYTDTADMGEDHLCSICYELGQDGKIYITDILFTPEPMEVTEPATASMLKRNDTRTAYIESNNGGRGFARNIQKLTPNTRVQWFHQSANKEARILSNAATVTSMIIFPADWRIRWGKFYENVTTYKRVFRANRFHDAADVLTGIIETENAKIDYSRLSAIQERLNGLSL